MKSLCGLYVITDSTLLPPETLICKVKQAIRGGARLVQYRNKGLCRGHQLEQARGLSGLCRTHGVPLIVNDDIELAADSGADGVHLGKDDASLEQARIRLGSEAIIGISCYNNLDLAVRAEKFGADYVAFGSFFRSVTKPYAVRASSTLLIRARAKLTIPICAIGGITICNAGILIDSGADMIAVISEVFASPHPADKARELHNLFAFRKQQALNTRAN
jgi:thiamine-phosphate pyrophosphorylase